MAKNKCSFTATPLVWIDVCSAKRVFPKWPGNGDFIIKFHNWMTSQGIFAVRSCGMGGGDYMAGFRNEDAERIVAWLKEQGTRFEGEIP